MPVLTRIEFQTLLPDLADTLAKDDSTFDVQERAAAKTAARLSGIAVPADVGDALEDLKKPVAHIIAFALAGTVKMDAERLKWLAMLDKQARKDLEDLRTDRAPDPTGETAPDDRTGTISDLPTW